MTQSTLRAQSRSGRISQRGDIAPAEELRCARLRAEGLALRRGWVSRGARRCDTVGDIVSKWKLRNVGKNRMAKRAASRRGCAMRSYSRPCDS